MTLKNIKLETSLTGTIGLKIGSISWSIYVDRFTRHSSMRRRKIFFSLSRGYNLCKVRGLVRQNNVDNTSKSLEPQNPITAFSTPQILKVSFLRFYLMKHLYALCFPNILSIKNMKRSFILRACSNITSSSNCSISICKMK